MDKNQRETRRQQEDKALNRGLIWVGGAIALEALLMLVNRYYINFFVSEIETVYVVKAILEAVRIGGAVIGVLALAWALLQMYRGGKTTIPTVVGLACLALAICAHVTLVFKGPGVRMLFFLVPAWAILALVYYIYHRELFLAAAASGMSVLGLWFVRGETGISVETVLVLVGIAGVAGVTAWLKKNNGVIQLPTEEEIRVLPKKCNYMVILASCGVGVVAMVAALLLGATVAYYLIFMMIAWLFALLVYYTVKLM